MAVAKTKTAAKGKWIDDIHASMGKFFTLETTDGIRREGRITGIRARNYKFNGGDVELPTEIELNGDPTDTVPMDRIATIHVNGLQT